MTDDTPSTVGPKDRYRDDMTEREIEALARDMCDYPDIRAPVQGYPGGIPWEMHMRAYEGYCAKYRGQVALINLYGRGCRGGFGTGELDEFLPGWRDELSERARMAERIACLEARVAELGWQPSETAPMWQVAIVTDGENVALAQKAESDFGGHYWSVEPDGGLDWKPTHWMQPPQLLNKGSEPCLTR
jgi:hypothetical protein